MTSVSKSVTDNSIEMQPIKASAPSRQNGFAVTSQQSSNGMASGNDDIDLREIFAALGRKRKTIIGMTLAALLGSLAFVNFVTPKYTAEARLLLENQDNYFARPEKDSRSGDTMIDAEDVLSQVQLAQSRDVARAVIKKLNLVTVPEFDPVLKGVPAYMRLPMMLGLVKDPTTITPEDRVLESYTSKTNIFAVGKSRVISAEVSSQDPKLAAKIANTIAEQYLEQQTVAKKQSTQNASTWLKEQVEPLRQKVIEAEARVEAFRSKSNLFVGTNNNTIANQQLSELNTQLSTARSTQADQQSRARLIRQALPTGRIFDFSEVLKDDLVRKLSENRSTLRALLASEERVYLPQHPRLKELSAQIGDLEGQIRGAAERTARSLENDARAASARVTGLLAEIEGQKKLSSQANEDDVQLKALEREAKSLREQFESYSAKANEATARDIRNPISADARIVTVALPPSMPSFPKALPIIAIATIGTLLLTIIGIIAGQLLKSPAPRQQMQPMEAATPAAKSMRKGTRSTNSTMFAGDFTGLPLSGADVPGTSGSGIDLPEPVMETPLSPQARMVLFPDSAYAQGIRALLQRCISHHEGQGATTVLMMGAVSGIGLTGAAINLARQLSQHGQVILVDLNEPNPGLDRYVEVNEPDGISDVFAGHIIAGDAIYKDRGSRAHIMPLGFGEANVAYSDLLPELMGVLKQSYDFVLLDTGSLPDAPVDLVADAELTVLAVASGHADTRIKQTCDELMLAGAKGLTVLRCEGKTASNTNTRDRQDEERLVEAS